MNSKPLGYKELREEIHKIFNEYFEHEMECWNGGEYDFEFMEFRTDDILRLIQRQGGAT